MKSHRFSCQEEEPAKCSHSLNSFLFIGIIKLLLSSFSSTPPLPILQSRIFKLCSKHCWELTMLSNTQIFSIWTTMTSSGRKNHAIEKPIVKIKSKINRCSYVCFFSRVKNGVKCEDICSFQTHCYNTLWCSTQPQELGDIHFCRMKSPAFKVTLFSSNIRCFQSKRLGEEKLNVIRERKIWDSKKIKNTRNWLIREIMPECQAEKMIRHCQMTKSYWMGIRKCVT